MKLIGAAFGIAEMCAAGAGAQTARPTDRAVDIEKKIEVKDGKDITVNGCLERNPGGGFMITNEAGAMKYALVTTDDLSGHVGHRVEAQGIAADRGAAKVKIESAVGTSGVLGDQRISSTNKATREAKGDLGLKYLGLKSVKMISESCR
jgi:hypothetical protein